MCYSLVGLFLFVCMIVALPANKIEKIGPNGPIHKEDLLPADKRADQKLENKYENIPKTVMAGDDTNSKETELLKLIESPVNDDTGKAVPVRIPHKIISGAIPAVHPERNWGRKMNEQQWRQNHARLNHKAYDMNKKVMHNRNTINDNRHDKKGMKIPRHIP